ncbi:MAG TPA: NADH-quinone oxidoreductase subunit NuoH [Candidatus Saccharimonadales bacterium]|jgi:NADH-quinone oxidoreductase subunit H|nr:NADH-quinone oxidoreductase subunit NuoH [Candidatus Saccharimonadales bacterium]
MTIPTTYLITAVVKIALVVFLLMTGVAYTTWLERKVIGRIQNRWGPTRVGPFGLLQPLADGIKFILKEDMIPDKVHRGLFILAPVLALVMSLISIAVIPFGEGLHVPVAGTDTQLQITGVNGFPGAPHSTDINIGLLIILGVTSIGVYGIALAGWSSNSKYALLGSLRASAQMISYELALGLSLVGVLLMAGTFSLREIVNTQAGFWLPYVPHWYIFPQFIAFFIYLMAAYAETNRIPFDLPEAETELVAGYHTEYSSMKFAMFFMAEYLNMITVSCIATLLFFGGWHGPQIPHLPQLLTDLLPVIWFSAKIFVFMFVYIWIRGTLPRFRYDQLMAFGWKFLLPLAIANIIVTSFIVAWRA